MHPDRRRVPTLLLSGLFLLLLGASPAMAHFVWVTPSEDGKSIWVYFGENGLEGDPSTLEYIEGIEVKRLTRGSNPEVLKYETKDDGLRITATPKQIENSLYISSFQFGVMTRGEKVFLLRYYAKAGPAIGHATWTDVDCSKHLDLDFLCTMDGDRLVVTASFEGKPVEGAQVKFLPPGADEIEAATDAKGMASFEVTRDGAHSVRVRHIQAKGGEHDGKSYKTTRHYASQTHRLTKPVPPPVAASRLPALPECVTSFGAAVLGDEVFVYGGHTGVAHSYDQGAQSGVLRKLTLGDAPTWSEVAKGPTMQGNALVPYNGKLYRVGGFQARNPEGAKHDLWSTSSVAVFDPKAGTWQNLPSLPEPRSSHDAVMLGKHLVVVGGWKLHGPNKPSWHDSAWTLDLDDPKATWQPLAQPPFQRRALAIAAHGSRLYVIGGMQPKGGPTTRVDYYDAETKTWTQGPDLVGKPFNGFGAAAFAQGGHLYATTNQGLLQRLNEAGDGWDVLGKLEHARFFHRMLPVQGNKLLLVGGANMSIGKYEEVDLVKVE